MRLSQTREGSTVNDASVNRSIAGSSNYQRRIEFDIHGLVGIRLVDPSQCDLTAVTKQLGTRPGPLEREPDITLRFVDRLPTSRVRYLGFNQFGFTDEGFFLFQQGERGVRIRIPFDRIGEQCEILCESGIRSVPLLMPILSITALRKGLVPLHASAFVHNGVGLLMAGWANCGKTTALLGFASKGAEYVGEELLFLSSDGQRMHGLLAELELSGWHLKTLPHVRLAIGRPKLLLLRALATLDRVQKMIQAGARGSTTIFRGIEKILTGLEHQLRPSVAPSMIFGNRIGSLTAKPDKIFLLISHDEPRIHIEATVPSEMARRMAFSSLYQLMPLMEHYLAYRYAFPEAKNGFIEHAAEYQTEILSRALAAKETYTVWHPYPLVFSDLYEQMRPFFEVNDRIHREAIPIFA
jgi:hypothetical protein